MDTEPTPGICKILTLFLVHKEQEFVLMDMSMQALKSFHCCGLTAYTL